MVHGVHVTVHIGQFQQNDHSLPAMQLTRRARVKACFTLKYITGGRLNHGWGAQYIEMVMASQRAFTSLH